MANLVFLKKWYPSGIAKAERATPFPLQAMLCLGENVYAWDNFTKNPLVSYVSGFRDGGVVGQLLTDGAFWLFSGQNRLPLAWDGLWWDTRAERALRHFYS